jgi:hypothetical protein
VQTPLHPSATPMHPSMTPMHPGMTPMHPSNTPAHPSQDPEPDYYGVRAGSSSRDRQRQQYQPPPPAAATPGGGGYNAPTPGLGGYTAAATPGMAETPGGAFAGVLSFVVIQFSNVGPVCLFRFACEKCVFCEVDQHRCASLLGSSTSCVCLHPGSACYQADAHALEWYPLTLSLCCLPATLHPNRARQRAHARCCSSNARRA